jgi:hypothetical protein
MTTNTRNRAFHRVTIFSILFSCLLFTSFIIHIEVQADDTAPAISSEATESGWQDNPYGIPVTRWMDGEGRRPISYQEWKANVGRPGSFEIDHMGVMSPAKGSDDEGLFCVVVASDIFNGIQTSLDQYVLDVAADGFTVSVHSIAGGQPENLRTFLQGKYAEGMVGAVLIGDLPVPWYESDCWDPVEHEEFPCDLYYMDMDGVWEDFDADGKFDEHYGNIVPEIWVGRLTASPMAYGGADEVTLLENYFYKNHLYRTGGMVLDSRGLAFIDDDWEPWAGSWSGNLGQAYSNRTTISDPYETTAPNYAGQLPQNYESILVCAHSGPTTHWFTTPSGNWTTIDYDEIVNIDPVAVFYNLFACSNARYVATNYMAGWYIFCQTYGLASIGSTKTGSMLEFGHFYGPFGTGKTIGESFADWFTAIGSDGMEQWEICWHYGMTLCGDPTLKQILYTPPSIITETLPDGFYGETYAATLAADKGTPPYSWQIIDGFLPKGLELGVSSGIISGTPDEVGTYDFTIEVADDNSPSCSDTAVFQMKVNYTCGDANNDMTINVADAVFLISYIFKGGPFPILMVAGDANCDGEVNVADCVYIINHVFSGGPEPCCP